jgi:hypothetical protein
MRNGDSGTPPYDELERKLRRGGLEMSRVGVASGTGCRGGETLATNGTFDSCRDWRYGSFDREFGVPINECKIDD